MFSRWVVMKERSNERPARERECERRNLMSDRDNQNCTHGSKSTPRIIAEEFRDLPTSDEHGAYISYFDTVLWVSDCLDAAKLPKGTEVVDDEEGERSIRRLCDRGDLVALGRKASNGVFADHLSEIPPLDWNTLRVEVTDGQPADDYVRYGGRCYGEASWVDVSDRFKLKEAWTALCFRKSDVLKHWPEPFHLDDSPETSPRDESGDDATEKSAPPLQVKIYEAYRELWPEGNFPARVKERDTAIIRWFIANGQRPPAPKTIHRALSTPR